MVGKTTVRTYSAEILFIMGDFPSFAEALQHEASLYDWFQTCYAVITLQRCNHTCERGHGGDCQCLSLLACLAWKAGSGWRGPPLTSRALCLVPVTQTALHNRTVNERLSGLIPVCFQKDTEKRRFKWHWLCSMHRHNPRLPGLCGGKQFGIVTDSNAGSFATKYYLTWLVCLCCVFIALRAAWRKYTQEIQLIWINLNIFFRLFDERILFTVPFSIRLLSRIFGRGAVLSPSRCSVVSVTWQVWITTRLQRLWGERLVLCETLRMFLKQVSVVRLSSGVLEGLVADLVSQSPQWTGRLLPVQRDGRAPELHFWRWAAAVQRPLCADFTWWVGGLCATKRGTEAWAWGGGSSWADVRAVAVPGWWSTLKSKDKGENDIFISRKAPCVCVI